MQRFGPAARLSTFRLLPGCSAGLCAAACAGPFSALDPAGPSGSAINGLWITLLILCTALFVFTMALLGLAWRGQRHLARIRDMSWLIAGGLALPAVTLAPLAIYGFAVGEQVFARKGAPDLTVEAIASQWRWDFAYPEAGGRTSQGVLHIPAGARVDVRLTSLDVIHSFWVPRLGGKLDAIPGHGNIIRITAGQPGIYRGLCSEYCGPGHAGMEFAVEAHEPSAYAAALSRLAPPATAGAAP